MICFSITVMTFKAYVTTVMSNSTYVSFHKVGCEQPSGEVGNFVAVCCKLPSVYVCQKLSKYNEFDENKTGAIFAPQCIFRNAAMLANR